MYHTPVLLDESINGLMLAKGGIYVDATFGGGGHSKEILNRMKGGKLFAFDRDPEAAENILKDKRLVLVNADYRYLKNYLKLHQAIPCDGILADLGISSHQIDVAERGFSTRYDGELDMRMDNRTERSAADIINQYEEETLNLLFRNYGEIKNSRKLARTITTSRQQASIKTTSELKEVASTCAPRGQEHKYLAQVFQAIRIEVNKELDSLEEFLNRSFEVLRPGGRIAVISYHSLEDRLVKNFLRSGNTRGIIEKDFYGNIKTGLKLITRKPITPGEEEIERNPRARSAKLRIGEKE